MKYSLISLLFISMLIFSCKSSKKSTGSNGVLIKNGTSKYSIIIPTKATLPEKRAGEMLQKYLEQISGVKLRLQYDKVPERPTEILIGNTNRNASKSLKRQSIDLGTDGFHVKSMGGKLAFVGGSKSGVEYGVYSYLEKYHNCRYFHNSEIVIPKNKEVVLGNVELQEVPAFEFRDNYYRPTWDNDYTIWHKLDHANRQEEWSSYWVHTAFTIIPPAKYFKSNPEYFSLYNGKRINDGQLCTTNEDVIRLTIKHLKDDIRKNGKKKYYSVSQNDTGKNCQCDKCSAINKKEGSPSGSILYMINKVAKAMPDITISTLAYTYSRKPPINIRPAKNVQIVLCTIEANRSKSIAKDSESSTFRNDINGWKKLTNNIMIWDYTINFSHLMAPFPNLRVLQPNLQYFKQNGINSIFSQGNLEHGGEFDKLRTYLISKLLWNPNIDIDKTMDNFLNGYYGAASSSIKKYINQMHDAIENTGGELHIYDDPEKAFGTYLTPSLLKDYNKHFDEAEKAVKGNSKYSDRVKTARLSLKYAELEFRKANLKGVKKAYSVDSRSSKISIDNSYEKDLKYFVATADKVGIKKLKEYGTSPQEYYQKSVSKIKSTKVARKSLSGSTTIKAITQPSKKYKGGNINTLIDGVKGHRLQHNTDWLGYEGNDIEFVVDFNESKTVKKVKMDFLANNSALIMDPVKVEYSFSTDGKNYTPISGVKKLPSEHIYGVFLFTFESPQLLNKKFRYLKVKATNMKVMPDWHPKKGETAWLFVDEIVVE